MPDVVVVGAGPNGLAAAVVLASAGLQVEVVEAADVDRRGSAHRRADPARLPARRLLGGPPDGGGVAVLPGLRPGPARGRDAAARGGLRPAAGRRPGRAGLARPGPDGRRASAPTAPPGARCSARWPGAGSRSSTCCCRTSAACRATCRPRSASTSRILEQGGPAWNRRFSGDVAPALLTGRQRARDPAAAPARTRPGPGLLLGAMAHSVGWPVPRGGSQAIVDAMAAQVVAPGRPDPDRGDRALARAAARSPGGAAGRLSPRPAGDRRRRRCPRRTSARCAVPVRQRGLQGRLRAQRTGAVGGAGLRAGRARCTSAARGPRWRRPRPRSRPGGTPERPYVLAAQPGVVDPVRAPAGQHTLWTYAHVPAGSTRDLGDVVTAQVERFAPGFRDLVLARNVVTGRRRRRSTTRTTSAATSPAGAPTPWQMVMRPVPRWDPYRTPIDGRLSLLGLDAARAGRARHGRGARGPARPAAGLRRPARPPRPGPRACA